MRGAVRGQAANAVRSTRMVPAGLILEEVVRAAKIVDTVSVECVKVERSMLHVLLGWGHYFRLPCGF